MLSISVLWAIADYDDDEIIRITLEDPIDEVDNNLIVTDSDDLEEIAQDPDDNELIETEWEWSLPPFEDDAEPHQISRDVLPRQRPTLTRKFAIEMRDRLNEEIAQTEIMPRNMAQMAQLEMNNLEITERSELDDEIADVEDQIRAPFYTIWMSPFDSANIAFDEYGYPIAPYLLRNQVVFNQATGDFMWNNFVIDREDLRYFQELSMVFEHRTFAGFTGFVGISAFSFRSSSILGTIEELFEDDVLAQRVASFLDKNINDSVTEAELGGITWFSEWGLEGSRITSIEGIQYLTNLQWLDLIDHEIVCIQPLSYLENLEWLDLSNNRIENIEALRYMTEWSWLILNYNKITDIRPLSNITRLHQLELRHNQISDIGPLSIVFGVEKPGIILDFSHNKISNISSLSQITSGWINLSGNQISSLIPMDRFSSGSLDVRNQTFTQSQPFTNPFSVTKSVIDNNWRTLEIFPMTPGGVPNSQGTGITWSWYHMHEIPESVSYGWNQVLTGSRGNIGHFSGTVTVPISDRPLGTIGSLFPDQRLAQAIATTLRKTLNCDVTHSQLNSITRLSINSGTPRVANLEGMQHLGGLTVFTASFQEISDLAPLSTLTNLMSLNLLGNRVNDITPLRNMTNMRDLNLGGNPIGSISNYLVHMRDLEILVLSGNNLTTLVGLQNLTNLRSLNLNGNQISSVIQLANMQNLEVLSISHNILTTLNGIQNLTNLVDLDASHNRLNSIPPMNRMVNLQMFNLSHNMISDITPLSATANIMFLQLNNNHINDVRPLAGLVNLELLVLNDNRIICIEPLSGLTNLWSLHMNSNDINCVEPLSGLVDLGQLLLFNNRIIDISPLSEMTSLFHLELANNRISDISPLRELTYHSSQVGARNQSVTQMVHRANPLVVQNIAIGTHYLGVLPYFRGRDGEVSQDQTHLHITWNNIPENETSVTYSWDESIMNPSWGMGIGRFSGTVTVQIVCAEEPLTVFPAVDLFVRNDRGLFRQTEWSYRFYNGLDWQAAATTADLQIGTNHATSATNGAYREAFMRFDLTSEQIAAIRNASPDSKDRIIFSLYVTDTHGTAQRRNIDLHLLPTNMGDRIHTQYPRWMRDGSNNVVRNLGSTGTWMTAWDAYRARITAREHFRYYQWATRPTVSSDMIYLNQIQFPHRLEFDLTDALTNYFNENPNATSFGFVLSILRGSGLVTVASSRNDDEDLRPRLTLPERERSMNAEFNNDTVSITGTSPANSQVLIRIFRPDNGIEMIYQVESNSNGEFNFNNTLIDAPNGTYQVLVSFENDPMVQSATFDVGNASVIREIRPEEPTSMVVPTFSNINVNSNSVLLPNRTLTPRITVQNNDDSKTQNMMFLVALYDKNRNLVDYTAIGVGVEPSTNRTLFTPLELPNNLDNHKVKIFMVEGNDLHFGSMIPFAEPIIIQNSTAQGFSIFQDDDLYMNESELLEIDSLMSLLDPFSLSRVDGVDIDVLISNNGTITERILHQDGNLKIQVTITNRRASSIPVFISMVSRFNYDSRMFNLIEPLPFGNSNVASGVSQVFTITKPLTQHNVEDFYTRIIVQATNTPATLPINLTANHADFFGNTPDTATLVPIDRLIEGRIDFDGDEDWLRFTVPESGIFDIETTGNAEIKLYTRNSEGLMPLQSIGGYYKIQGEQQHYIKITGDVGEWYTLRIASTNMSILEIIPSSSLRVGNFLSIPIAVTASENELNNMEFSLSFDESDFSFHRDSHNVLNSTNFTFRASDNPSILTNWRASRIVNTITLRAKRAPTEAEPMTVIVFVYNM